MTYLFENDQSKKVPNLKLNTFTTYILAVLSMVFWGLSFVWSTIVFRYYDPITTVFLRLVISAAVLFLALSVFKRIEKIKKSDYKLILLSSLFNPFLYFIGESFGLKLTSPTISAVIIALIPVFTPVVAFFYLHERLSPLNIAGLIMSFVGVLIMILKPDLTLASSPFGVLCLLFAVFSALGYAVLLKKLTQKYNPFTIIAVQNLIGAFYFLPLFLIFGFRNFIQVRPNIEVVAALLQLAVFASSIAYVFYTFSARELGISKANLMTNIIPVMTAIFSYFILDELFTISKIMGMIVVISGVILSQTRGFGQLFKRSGKGFIENPKN